MEIQFEAKTCTCLETSHNKQILEKTQEHRLGDELPDVGKILGCWGQTMIRSKENRGGEIGINGGILIGILYVPDGGGAPCTISDWIPFSSRWDSNFTDSEGTILCRCNIQSIDARSISARKLMIRASICVQIQYCYKKEFPLYYPENVAENIQMLKHSYPVQLPKEAGEKDFQIEETLEHLASDFYQLVYCTLHPQILEKKVMTDKLLFRGVCHLHFLYMTDEGLLKKSEIDLPFSQYNELTGIYDADCSSLVQLSITGLELGKNEEGILQLNAGVVGEYTIYSKENITLVEDSYGIRMKVQCVREENKIPAILDSREQTIPVRINPEIEALECLDAVFYPEQVAISGEDNLTIKCYGSCLILYKDLEGQLRSTWTRWESSETMESSQNNIVNGDVSYCGDLHWEISGTSVYLDTKLILHTMTQTSQGITAVKSLVISDEPVETDFHRPSLIIRSAGTEDLWHLAKSVGSTTEDISRINGIGDSLNPDQLLLIPLL